MKALTHTQAQVLDAIKDLINRGSNPTVAELQRMLGRRNHQPLIDVINRIERKGYLVRIPGRLVGTITLQEIK